MHNSENPDQPKVGKEISGIPDKDSPHHPPQHLEAFDRAVLSLQCLVTSEKHFPRVPLGLSLPPWRRMT